MLPTREEGPRAWVEILYVDGCPNHQPAVGLVERLSRELGIGAELHLVKVPDWDAARRLRFLGSPTIRIGGVDVDPRTSERNDFGLSCRVFQTESGISSHPDERWVREALLREAGGGGERLDDDDHRRGCLPASGSEETP